MSGHSVRPCWIVSRIRERLMEMESGSSGRIDAQAPSVRFIEAGPIVSGQHAGRNSRTEDRKNGLLFIDILIQSTHYYRCSHVFITDSGLWLIH